MSNHQSPVPNHGAGESRVTSHDSRRPLRGYALLREFLPLLVIIIEFCWLYPWVLLLTGVFYGRTPTPLLPAWLAFAVLFLGHLTVRAALSRPWSLLTARGVVAGVGLVAGLVAVKVTYYPRYGATDLRWLLVLARAAHDALPVVVPAVTGALTAALLWWRGVVLGEREFNYFEVDRAFRRGVVWSILFVLLLALYGDTRGFAVTDPAPVYLLAFFSLSLTTLAIARLIAIWQETRAEDAQALAMNRHWVLLLVGVVGLIFLVAIMVSGAAQVQVRPALLQLLAPLGPVVEYLFLVLFAIALVIARAILFVISHLPFSRRFAPLRDLPQRSFTEIFEDLPPRLVSGARWGMVVLVVVVLILLVALAVVRARRRSRKQDEDERESVWSTEAVLAGLGAAWRSLLARLRPPRRPREMPAIGAIRAIYRELLRQGAHLGIPRLVHQTPYEYQPRLTQRIPGHSSEVASLTDAYVRVRYTPHLPTQDEVTEAQSALERIRAATDVNRDA